MLERVEAIGMLVILAVMLAVTLCVGVRRTSSFAVAFAPVELALAAWWPPLPGGIDPTGTAWAPDRHDSAAPRVGPLVGAEVGAGPGTAATPSRVRRRVGHRHR